MEKLEKYSSSFCAIMSIIFGYQFYDDIAQHLLLRVSFCAVLVFSAIVLLINAIQTIFFKKSKSRYLLRGMRYLCILAFVVCLSVGIIVHNIESTVKVSCYGTINGYSEFNNGDLYELVEEHYTISATIWNNSSKSIQIKPKDVVSLELIEFKPYQQLDIKNNYSISIGADGLINPIVFVYNVDTDSVLQKYENISYGLKSILNNDSFLVVEPNDISELMVHVYMKEEGSYKYRVKVNYHMNGEKYSKTISEITCICKAGPYKELTEADDSDYNRIMDEIF